MAEWPKFKNAPMANGRKTETPKNEIAECLKLQNDNMPKCSNAKISEIDQRQQMPNAQMPKCPK